MKKITQYLLLFLFVALWACSSENDLVKPGGQEKPSPVKESIELQNSLQPFAADASEAQVLKFKANCDWLATVDKEWCHLSKVKGEAGEHQLSITVDSSEELMERDARLVIVSVSDTVQQILRIVQKQRDALLLSSERAEIGVEGGLVKITVRANVSYEYAIETDAQSWVKPSQTRAVEENTLSFEVAANESVNGRSAKITFTSGALKETFTLYQEGEKPQLILYLNQANPQAWNEKNLKIDVKTNVDYTIEVPAEATWCRFVETRTLSSFAAYFTLEENHTSDIRSVKVAFLNSERNIREELEITQMYKGVIDVKTKEVTLTAEAQRFDINLESNVKFTVKSDQDWITYMPETRSMTASTLAFDVKENTGGELRSANITLDYTATDRSEDHVVEIIRVTQDAQIIPVNPQMIYITHNNPQMNIPILSGDGMSARVLWDNGLDWMDYSPSMKFGYVGQGPYVLQIMGTNIDEIYLPQLTKVQEINLSAFEGTMLP